MSEKYKIHIDKPSPSDQEINQFKNFDRVLNQYNRRNKKSSLHTIIFKQNKLFPIVIIILIMLGVIYYFKRRKEIREKEVPVKMLNYQPNYRFVPTAILSFPLRSLNSTTS